MAEVIGSKFKEKDLEPIKSRFKLLAAPDEEILGIFRATRVIPTVEFMLISNLRVVGMRRNHFHNHMEVVNEKLGKFIKAVQPDRTEAKKFVSVTPLKVIGHDGKSDKYLTVEIADINEILRLVEVTKTAPSTASILIKQNKIVAEEKQKREAVKASENAAKQEQRAAKQAEKAAALQAENAQKYSGTCPRCGSDRLQPLTKTRTQGVSTVNSTAGCCCLGPLGLLCGLPGAGASHTTVMRMCMNCGKQFK